MPHPFDVDSFLSLLRVSGLAVSPDGERLVTCVARVAPDGKKFASSLWSVDPSGVQPARRLTWSPEGESLVGYGPDGSLYFTSTRKAPDQIDDDEDRRPALWALPPEGGEASLVVAPPDGAGTVAIAADRGTLAYISEVFPGAATQEEDEARAKARKDTGVSALLIEDYPMRHWDHELGPRQPNLFVLGRARSLTPDPGRALDNAEFALSPDGATLVTGWAHGQVTDRQVDLLAIDVASGDRRTLAAIEGEHTGPACSPDGQWVVCVRETHGIPDHAVDKTLWLTNLASGEGRDLLSDFDRWPQEPAWAPDSSAVYFTADDGGHTLPFRVDLAAGEVRRLAAEGTFGDLAVAPDGTTVYAVRSSVASPAALVALRTDATDQMARPLPTPGGEVEGPGRVERVTAAAADGVEIGSWLVLPPDASPEQPAPLVVFVHGGPLSSWSGWHWRWNPHLLAARGYAVLMPDPALSTGYGQAFIQRGWGQWGGAPYTDIMAATDAAVARADIDADRTALMGGSFGGYMANWIAGHTDRFLAIVTHASLWALDQFHGTSDDGVWWEREFGDPYQSPERYVEASPHRHIANIRTPMLVIHGESDDRVPISEGLRLWTDLTRHGVEAKFLFFPDENHWVLKPQHSRLWYETVLAFLDHHVLGRPWRRPDLV